MKKKLLVLAWPIGFVLFLIYSISNHFIPQYPEIMAYLLLGSSVLCMLVGCFYYGYCASKGLNPYKF